MVLLGTRPLGMTPGFHALGRETFLVPVEWVDDWPVVGDLVLDMDRRPSGDDAPTSGDSRDDFEATEWDPRWLAIRAPREDHASLVARPGWLTLHGTESLEDHEPAFVGRRQQHPECRVRARLDVGSAVEAGLTVWMDDRSHYDVAVRGERVVVRGRIGPLAHEVATAVAPRGPVVLELRCELRVGGTEPDVVTLGHEDDHGDFRPLATLPGRYLSTEVAGGFTGRLIGMFAVGGTAAFDWFEYWADNV
jgi:beta-xylosidase